MNKDIYGVLKKAITSGTLSPIDLSIAEHACDKYERDSNADREGIRFIIPFEKKNKKMRKKA